MTPAEFKTIREACGLSFEQAAEMFGVKYRSVQRWERNERAVPESAADKLRELDSLIDVIAMEILDMTEEQHRRAKEMTGNDPEFVTLTRYKEKDFLALKREYEGLADKNPALLALYQVPFASVHATMIGRARRLLENAGYKTTITFYSSS